MLSKNFLILSLVTLVSCGKTQHKKPAASSSSDPTDNLNVQISSFSEIDTSGILMFPLSMGESKRSGGSLVYKEMPGEDHWNIIFYNSATAEYHLLSDRKMLINGYDLKYHSDDGRSINTTYRHIFYRITTYDFNNDKLLNDEDPEYLFVSDKKGHNLKQISPEFYSVISWQFIKSSNNVIMLVKKDSDANKIFDENDEITTFAMDVDKDSIPKQLFSEEFKGKLKSLYDRDWKRLN